MFWKYKEEPYETEDFEELPKIIKAMNNRGFYTHGFQAFKPPGSSKTKFYVLFRLRIPFFMDWKES